MKKRLQITVGPDTQEIVKKMAAKFRLETRTEWSDVDVLESAASQGLRMLATRFKLKREHMATLRD